jgi:hypothetical protein
MQVEMLRGSRTAKENPIRARKLTTISTVTATRNENNRPQQARFFYLFEGFTIWILVTNFESLTI